MHNVVPRYINKNTYDTLHSSGARSVSLAPLLAAACVNHMVQCVHRCGLYFKSVYFTSLVKISLICHFFNLTLKHIFPCFLSTNSSNGMEREAQLAAFPQNFMPIKKPKKNIEKNCAKLIYSQKLLFC